MSKFELLKQSFYDSKYDRYCDGYKLIINNITPEERENLGIKDDDLQEIIKEGEKYLYRVAKVNGKLEYKAISLKSFEIIRKHFKHFNEED